MTVDLEALRCPNAQLALNRLLTEFEQSEHTKLCLRTIEPSLLRSLKQRIEHYDRPLNIAKQQQETITPERMQLWLDRFDEEDFEDVEHIAVFHIEKQ